MGTVYPPFITALILHVGYGKQTSYIPTYIRLTMANYENLKLTGALWNAHQKYSSLRLIGRTYR